VVKILIEISDFGFEIFENPKTRQNRAGFKMAVSLTGAGGKMCLKKFCFLGKVFKSGDVRRNLVSFM
jgi:hypothetical protein